MGRPISRVLKRRCLLPVSWRIALWALLFAAMAPIHLAQAGTKHRVSPDLRRDALRWTGAGVTRHGPHTLPLTIHIAVDEAGEPVVDLRRIRRWVRRANADLAVAGIQVQVSAVRLLPTGWDEITRRRQRRALATYAPKDGSIHVFVTGSLDTARQRSLHRRIRGLHWRYRGINRELRDREYVVVTEGAPLTTFAHELGHLFGLGHSTSLTNIMCSCRRGPAVSFTSEQGESMRVGVERFAVRQHDEGRRARWADRARP